jgi:hypothetical protein
MTIFPITAYRRFSELPLEQFQLRGFSIYVLDFEWNYLFVNDFVKHNLGDRAQNIIGKNMWAFFPALRHDFFFSDFKRKMEKSGTFTGVSVSPLTGQRLRVTGHALEDCFYCTSSILPNKEELISDLRKQLVKG